MRRYWIDASDLTGNPTDEPSGRAVIFRDETFHHIVHVCRQDVGSKFEVLPGDGRAYFVEMTSVAKKEARATVLEMRTIAPLPQPQITLAVSMPRFATFDLILEKVAELGVARVIPFTSEFSFVRDLKTLEQKSERWQKIVRGACQQSGRGHLMELAPAQTLQSTLKDFETRKTANRNGSVTGLFPYEGPAAMDVRGALESVTQDKAKGEGEFWVFVGSEGGFSPKEVELFQQFNFAPTTLGPQVLRVETACLALVAIIRYALGQLR